MTIKHIFLTTIISISSITLATETPSEKKISWMHKYAPLIGGSIIGVINGYITGPIIFRNKTYRSQQRYNSIANQFSFSAISIATIIIGHNIHTTLINYLHDKLEQHSIIVDKQELRAVAFISLVLGIIISKTIE